MQVAITGIAAVSGLGNDLDAHEQRMEAGQNALRPLADLLGSDSNYAALSGAWIESRELMSSRKWAPGSTLSLHVAKQAIEDAGLTQADLTDAAVIVGSSRGNVAGWVAPWPKRRAFDLMAASNSMHGELASAISIELGIRGPWQVIASGCAASLDALGMAWMMIRQGVVKRAIVVGVELPLIPEVLDTYAKTGVLATTAVNDPYSPDAGGFFPGEAGAAIVLESVSAIHERRLAMESAYPGGHLTSAQNEESTAKSVVQMTGYWCNSDAASPIGMPKDGAGVRDCVRKAVGDLSDEPSIAAVCPHASGTLLHGKAELAALRESLPRGQTISLHPLKPYTGHTVGASGVLDAVILTHYLRKKKLPPNLPGLSLPGAPFDLSSKDLDPSGSTVLKIAVGMGGHNSVVSLRSPSV
jgi:3-oxoacyl-[acyl-carrier-protein] synthase II